MTDEEMREYIVDQLDNPDVYSADTVRELNSRVDSIHRALDVIEKNFVYIAFDLYWIYENRAYKSMGCESITDFCKKKFGFSKTTTYEYLELVERFGERDEKGDLLECKIDPVYKDYSKSKLSAISGLSDEEIKSLDITPDMSTRDIKKVVKKYEDRHAIDFEALDSLIKQKNESSNDSPDSPSGEEKEDQQQELQIGDDNTVTPPPDAPDQDKSDNDLRAYCHVGESQFMAWQKDEKTKDKFVSTVFENIFKKYPGAEIYIYYRVPPKKKGGKRK